MSSGLGVGEVMSRTSSIGVSLGRFLQALASISVDWSSLFVESIVESNRHAVQSLFKSTVAFKGRLKHAISPQKAAHVVQSRLYKVQCSTNQSVDSLSIQLPHAWSLYITAAWQKNWICGSISSALPQNSRCSHSLFCTKLTLILTKKSRMMRQSCKSYLGELSANPKGVDAADGILDPGLGGVVCCGDCTFALCWASWSLLISNSTSKSPSCISVSGTKSLKPTSGSSGRSSSSGQSICALKVPECWWSRLTALCLSWWFCWLNTPVAFLRLELAEVPCWWELTAEGVFCAYCWGPTLLSLVTTIKGIQMIA